MKNIFICFLVMIASAGFSQPKKKQIQSLTLKMDSLLQSKRNQADSFLIIVKSLNNQIINQKNILINLDDSLEDLRNKLVDKEQKINFIKNQVDSLNTSFASLNESIESQLNDDPITFLDSVGINLTNEYLIQLFNISDQELRDNLYLWNETNRPSLEITAKKFYVLGKKEYCLAVLEVENPNDCHACQGTSFIGCFEKIKSGWKMIGEKYYTGQAGNWGKAANFEEFVVFGKRRLGVILSFRYFDRGTSSASQIFCGLDNNNSIKDYYSCDKYYYSQSNTDLDKSYNIELTIKENGNEYYDLIETKTIKGRKPTTRILKFNTQTMKYQ